VARFFKFDENRGTGKFINLDHVTYAEYYRIHDPEYPAAGCVTVQLQKGSLNQVFDIRGTDADRLVEVLEAMTNRGV
jgi:hypothetical protein